MDKNEIELRDQLLADITAGLQLVLARVPDPAVAALTLSGTEGVTMAAEGGTHVFRMSPGPYLEHLLKVMAEQRPGQANSGLREIQHALRQEYGRALKTLAASQRTAEAAARLWRPVNVVVSGVRDGGEDRR